MSIDICNRYVGVLSQALDFMDSESRKLNELRYLALEMGKSIHDPKVTFNGEKVYKIHGVVGLYTISELKNAMGVN